jgi:hypothetical protein
MWCCRRIKRIRENSRVKIEEVLHRVTKERNIVRTTNRRDANWIRGCAQRGVICRAAAPTSRLKIEKKKKKHILQTLRHQTFYVTYFSAEHSS